MTLFEALPTEVLGLEALLQGRYREAVAYFERARAHYVAHNLYRAWGTFAKFAHSEALLCLADEVGAEAVPELLGKLRANAKVGRRMSRLRVFRGWGSLMTGVYQARRGDEKAARRLFERALAERGKVDRPSYMDLCFKIRIAFERLRLGDSKTLVAAMLDEVNVCCDELGFVGMSRWLERMRTFHAV